MNTELREAWEDSMLSGLFPQGTGYLNNGGQYCCLGVLCETAISLGMPVERSEPTDYDTLTKYRLVGGDGHWEDSMLSGELLELFDMTNDDQNRLAEANDNGFSFEDIINVTLVEAVSV